MRGLREVRAPEESPAAAERPAIALDLDDLYVAEEPVTLRARLVNVERSAGAAAGSGGPVDAAGGGPPTDG